MFCFHAFLFGEQAWITEMAAFIKSLDQKHLVTVGLEGFYGLKTTERSGVNPGDWASKLGSDFIQNSAIDDIDFASVHAYPDSWLVTTTAICFDSFKWWQIVDLLELSPNVRMFEQFCPNSFINLKLLWMGNIYTNDLWVKFRLKRNVNTQVPLW